MPFFEFLLAAETAPELFGAADIIGSDWAAGLAGEAASGLGEVVGGSEGLGGWVSGEGLVDAGKGLESLGSWTSGESLSDPVRGPLGQAWDSLSQGWKDLGPLGQNALTSGAKMLMAPSAGRSNAGALGMNANPASLTAPAAPSLGAGGLGVGSSTLPGPSDKSGGSSGSSPGTGYVDPTSPQLSTGVLNYNPAERTDSTEAGSYSGALARRPT